MSSQPLPAQPSQVALGDDECWRLLSAEKTGRLATSVAGEPEIFPVSHAVAGYRVYVRTRPGTKLSEITMSPRVAFEVDHVGQGSAWSVVLKGHATVLQGERELQEARATGLVSYLEDGKSEWIRITPVAISGRRVVPGEA